MSVTRFVTVDPLPLAQRTFSSFWWTLSRQRPLLAQAAGEKSVCLVAASHSFERQLLSDRTGILSSDGIRIDLCRETVCPAFCTFAFVLNTLWETNNVEMNKDLHLLHTFSHTQRSSEVHIAVHPHCNPLTYWDVWVTKTYTQGFLFECSELQWPSHSVGHTQRKL